MSDYELGARVSFRRCLNRETKKDGHVRRRVWVRSSLGRGEVVHGVIVGARHLTDGMVEGGWEEPAYYQAERTFPAYLVSYHLRRRPVFVLPDDLWGYIAPILEVVEPEPDDQDPLPLEDL